MGKQRLGVMATPVDQDRLQDWRGHIERVIDYADHLDPSDRALLRGIYDRGMSAAAMARATRRDPRQVQHRVRVLTARLGSPAFRFVLRHCRDWPEDRRRVAEAVILRGATQRSTASRLGLTIHSVRREIDRVRLLFEQEQTHSPPAVSSQASSRADPTHDHTPH